MGLEDAVVLLLLLHRPCMITSLENRVHLWIDTHIHGLLRRALGIIFLWFGVLKFCPGLCEVELLAQRTLMVLSGHLLTPRGSIQLLAIWECAMGITLLLAPDTTRWGRILLRACAISLVMHLVGTFLPLALFPNDTWKIFPYAPTLTGQYILKNLVLITAALAIYVQSSRRLKAVTA